MSIIKSNTEGGEKGKKKQPRGTWVTQPTEPPRRPLKKLIFAGNRSSLEGANVPCALGSVFILSCSSDLGPELVCHGAHFGKREVGVRVVTVALPLRAWRCLSARTLESQGHETPRR